MQGRLGLVQGGAEVGGRGCHEPSFLLLLLLPAEEPESGRNRLLLLLWLLLPWFDPGCSNLQSARGHQATRQHRLDQPRSTSTSPTSPLTEGLGDAPPFLQ
jgi:hypothetical protein